MTRQPFDTLPRAQQAAILGGEDQFRAFIAERYGHPREADPAPFVRSFCGVTSRRELATNTFAAQLFDTLRTEYDAWRGKIGAPTP